MKFGSFPLAECEGAILAHSFKSKDLFVKKGSVLSRQMLAEIGESGVQSIVVARLEPGDVDENKAAAHLARVLQVENIDVADAGTGRVNFHAALNGVFTVSRKLIDSINAVDPGITIATLKEYDPVLKGRMVATIKIIPYAVPMAAVDAIGKLVKSVQVMGVAPYVARKISVISTRTSALKKQTIAKTLRNLEVRLKDTGSTITSRTVTEHNQKSVSEELAKNVPASDLVIIFGASAISDIDDVVPAAIRQAGGAITRFGMPVDPGNLLLLGKIGAVDVMGAPGCARSPAENGFDHVLQRKLAGIEVSSGDIAQMGVGGLLMEIGSRPQPRSTDGPLNMAAMVLAAGRGSRMAGANKMTTSVNGVPMVRHVAKAALDSGFNTHVITGHEPEKVHQALSGLDIVFDHNEDFVSGLSSSLKTGISGIGPEASHILVLLGDMPGITSAMLKKMITRAGQVGHNTILMATCEGRRGNPVLWPRAYFEELASLSGDSGARHLLEQYREQVEEVELGSAAAFDIDTPEALEAFSKRKN